MMELSREEVGQKMREILREQLDRPALRPSSPADDMERKLSTEQVETDRRTRKAAKQPDYSW